VKISDWQSIKHFKPADFTDPSALKYSIVNALDLFCSLVGEKPVILSDYRPYNPAKPKSKHALGIAIDTTWPNEAVNSGLFGAVGVYINKAKVASFHFDTRPKKPDGSLYKWGGIITRPGGLKNIQYTGASVVLDMFPKIGIAIPLIVLIGWLVWKLTKK
jgi:hypothetical protein